MRVTGKQISKLQRLWKRKYDVVLATLRNRKDTDISQRNKIRNFAMKLSKITFRPFVKGTILQKPLIMSLIFVPLLRPLQNSRILI